MYQFSYAQWDLIQEPIEGYECFWDIQFVNAEVGYVVGPDIVGKTMDGGLSGLLITAILVHSEK